MSLADIRPGRDRGRRGTFFSGEPVRRPRVCMSVTRCAPLGVLFSRRVAGSRLLARSLSRRVLLSDVGGTVEKVRVFRARYLQPWIEWLRVTHRGVAPA